MSEDQLPSPGPKQSLASAIAALVDQTGDADPRPPEASFTELLEKLPLFSPRAVRGLADPVEGTLNYPNNLQLHCDNPRCNGVRRHSPTPPRPVKFHSKGRGFHYCAYVCVNCGIDVKVFGLRTTHGRPGLIAVCEKIYQQPTFGTPIPPKFFAVIGEENREHFLNARRSIARGLGIGAFAYYRRIVEDEKLNLVSSVLKVAKATNSSANQIKLLEKAANERRFSKAMEMLREASAIPPMLLISGQNPLGVLHDVLSDGIHALTEEECLHRSMHAETILCELVVRMNSAVADQTAITEAMKKVRKSETK